MTTVTAGYSMTLKQMREAMNGGQGMTAQEVADLVARELGRPARSGESIANIERRGIKDYYVIRALAAVYNRPYEEIAEAARPTGRK